MSKRSKRYLEAAAKVDREMVYQPGDAFELLKSLPAPKFDETVEVVVRLVFGPYISQWQRDRTVPREAKRKAYSVVVVTFVLSIALVDATWLRGTLGAVGIALISFLAWLPTTRRGHEIGRDPD